VAEVATILSRRNFQRALKDIAHRIDVSEAALARDRFHAVLTFFQSPARRFHAQAFDKFRGVVFISLVKTRAKLRGLIATRCASTGTVSGLFKLSSTHDSSSRNGLRSVNCRESAALNCDCPPGRRK